MVAPGLAEPPFAVADTNPIDQRGDVRAESMPAEVVDLGADPEIVGGDLVAIAPPVVLGLCRWRRPCTAPRRGLRLSAGLERSPGKKRTKLVFAKHQPLTYMAPPT